MLKLIIANLDEINKITARNKVGEWKVFGTAIGEKFPITADCHILIIPTEQMLPMHWDALNLELTALFNKHLIRVYAFDGFDDMVTQGLLSASDVEYAQNSALGSAGLQALFNVSQVKEPVTSVSFKC